jgi:2-polyprenyl-6-methoxyphenol hydroxylase-like FAD-dependent oxidoreductase
MKDEYLAEVMICGAGAAGLTLALELARRDVSFVLIDRLDMPFRGSRGKGIQPRTLEIFDDLGIVDRLAAAGGPYPPQRSYRDDGSSEEGPLAEQRDPNPAEPYGAPLMVLQATTEDRMRERLLELGHAPLFGTALTAFSQDEDGVNATVSGRDGERTLRVRYLVGADGGRSSVRHLLGIGFPGKTLGVRALVADVALTGLERDAWHRFGVGSMERQVWICPLAGTDLFQVQGPVPLEGDVDLSAAGLEALLRERSGRGEIRIHAVHWSSVYSMSARLADRYRGGRVFLAGDSAHVHPPTGGQGLNTSIQDAYNLGWKLAAVLRGAPEALLDSYEEERRPVAQQVLGLSTRLLDAAKQGEMRRTREVQQLDIGYAASSLALERPARSAGVRAGERAPDAPLRGAAGQALRLFDLLRGPHWTLLGYQAGHEVLRKWCRPGMRIHDIGPLGELVDAGGHFADAYGVAPGELVLVRPDGHVGVVLGPDQAGALEDYLTMVGLGPRAYCPGGMPAWRAKATLKALAEP